MGDRRGWRQLSGNLRVTKSVTLTGSATVPVTATVGPGVSGPAYWHVTGLVAQTNRPGVAPIPRFQAYLNEANAAYSLGLTYDGSFTSAVADEHISRGQNLVFAWTGGQAGDVATVTLTGATDNVPI